MKMDSMKPYLIECKCPKPVGSITDDGRLLVRITGNGTLEFGSVQSFKCTACGFIYNSANTAGTVIMENII